MELPITSGYLSLIIFLGVLVSWGLCQQQPSVGGQQQAIPPLTPCRCDQLEQCLNEHSGSLNDLENRCRHDCGVAFLANETGENVTKCFEEYARGKRDKRNGRTRCMENLIGKNCVSDQQQPSPTQLTLSVDQSKMAQRRVKRNYKIYYPGPLNLYNACVKTCMKNRGKVEFNPDGTPIKPTGKGLGVPGAPNIGKGQKAPKGYALCAAQLNCQLVPHDKKLEKQAKDICKYEAVQKEDFGFKLCKCLESAFNQTFSCMSTMATPSCSSESGESGAKSGCSASGNN